MVVLHTDDLAEVVLLDDCDDIVKGFVEACPNMTMAPRFQFSTRALCVVMALMMLPAAVVGTRVRFYERQAAIQRQFDNDRRIVAESISVSTDALSTWLLGGRVKQVFCLTITEGDVAQWLVQFDQAGASEVELVYVDGFESESPPTINREGFASLARFSRLRHLALEEVPVLPADLAGLNALSHLESLDLSGESFGDEHVAQIPPHLGLAEIRLDCAKISSAGIRTLSRHKNLKVLKLHREEQDDMAAGLRELQESLPDIFVLPARQGVFGQLP